MKNVYQQIRENLSGRVSGVNIMAALNRIDDFEEGVAALNEMCTRGQVEVINIPAFSGGRAYHKAYRLRPPVFPQLVVDNTKELDSKES